MIELKPAINEVKLTLKSISSPINLGTVVEPVSGGSVPTDVRQAIYTLLENAAYATTGLEDEIAIVQAWAQEVTALSLEPTSLELSNDTPQTIVATVVPSGSTVLWSSSNEAVATVFNGVVTGVGNGSCVITATAGNKTANCAVTVSGFATLESISAVYTQSGTVYETDSLDSLKTDLVVTATYSDTSTATISSDSYTLSGTLEVGTSTITVAYGGKTDSFSVTVSAGWRYLPSMGKLSDQDFASLSAGTLVISETVENGTLKLTADAQASSNNKAFLFTPATHGSSAYFKIQFKLSSLDFYVTNTTSSAVGVVDIRFSNGTGGSRVGFARYGTNAADPRPRYIVGSTTSWAGSNITLNEWHTLEVIYANSKQTIKIDGNNVISNQNLSTSYTVANALYMFGNNNSIPLEFYIKEIEYNED